MPNFRINVEQILSSNAPQILAQFEAAEQRILARGRANVGVQGARGKVGLTNDLRRELAAQEIGVAQSVRGGDLTAREGVALRQQIRQRFEGVARELTNIFPGGTVPGLELSQVRDIRRRLGGEVVGGQAAMPSYANPANTPTRQMETSLTRLQAQWAEMAAVDEEYILERGRLIATMRRLRAAESRAAIAVEDPAGYQMQVEERSARSTYNRALKKDAIAHEVASAEAQGQGPGGFAKTVGGLTGRNPLDVGGAGEFLGSRFVSTAAYGASAAILYGFVNQMRNGAREALALQRATSQLRAELNSLGDGSKLPQFRSDLLSIARETGTLGSEVVEVGAEMRGVFGDTELAAQRTAEVVRAAQVSGLGLSEVTNELTAASKTYSTSIDAITDKAAGMHERFGVPIAESIKAFGEFAPVAQEVGLSLDQVAGILGVVNQRTGRGISAVTEAYSRILPALQEKAPDLLRIADDDPTLHKRLPEIQKEIREGNPGQVLISLAKDWEQLNKSTKNNIISTIGSRREAQYLIPLFEGHRDLLKEITSGNLDAGKAMKYQAELSRTLGYQLAKMRQEFNQLIDSLARLGLLSGFELLAVGVSKALGFLAGFFRILAQINDLAGGVPGRLLGIALAVQVLVRSMRALAEMRAIFAATGIGGGIGQVFGAAGGSIYSVAAPEGAGALTRAGYGVGNLAGLGYLGALGASEVPGTAGLTLGGIGAGGGLAAGAATAGLGLALGGIAAFDWHEFQGIRKSDRDSRRAAIGAYSAGTLDLQQFEHERTREEAGLSTSADYKRRSAIATRAGHPLPTFSGNETSEVDAAFHKTLADRYRAATDLGFLDPKKTAAEVEKIAHATEKGHRAESQDLDLSARIQKLDAAQQKQIDSWVKHHGDVADAIKSKGADQAASVQELQQQYESGDIAWGKYIDGLTEQVKVLKDAEGSDEKIRQQRVQAQQQVAAALSAHNQAVAQALVSLGVASGGNQAVLQAAAARQQIFASGAKPLEIVQAYEQYVGALQSQLSYEVSHATTAAQAANLARTGSHIDAAVIAKARDAFKKAGIPEADIDEWVRLQQDEAEKIAQDAEVAERAATRRRAGGPGGLDESANAIARADRAVSDAQDKYNEAQSLFDKGQGKKVDVDNAAADLADAQKSAADARRQRVIDTLSAQRDLEEATAGDNNLLLAQIAQKRADDAAVQARGAGPVAELKAQAERIKADRAMEDYLADASKARRDLAIAMAESVGNMAEVGRLNVQQAEDDLRVVKERYAKGQADQADVDKAEATAVRARTTERDRARNERVSDLEYLYEFDKITAGQLIASLTLELSKIPETNKDARRQIERRIKQLRDDMSKDIQFNLPTTFALPTLYEGRRLAQTGGQYSAGAYTDNRVVQVFAQTDANPQDIADAIVNAFDSAPRTGIEPKAY